MADEHDPHSGDPYEILGVPDDASMEEIRAAFKKLALLKLYVKGTK